MKNNILRSIAIGTVQFGVDYGISNQSGKTSKNEVSEILKYAWKNGVDTLDTAHGYGDSEITLGEKMIHEFKIITKLHNSEDIYKIKEAFFESLDHLNRSKINGLLAHDARSLILKPKLWDFLEHLKHMGYTNKIGYSLYYPEDLEKLLSLDFIPDLIQIPLNILDTRFVPYIDELKARGCEIHTRSAFLQGVLFLEPNSLSDFFNPIKPILEKLRTDFPSVEERSSFLIKECLITGIDKVVIGVNNLSQLKSITKGLKSSGKDNLFLSEEYKVDEKILLPFNWPKK